MTRFLNEDPWERLRLLKRAAPKTPLQMLLRGQNLVGYRHYPDDVVRAFVQHAADCGVDVFRIFDALNDERNLRTAMEAARACGKHVQAAVCYSLTEHKLGGPVYTIDYFVEESAGSPGYGSRQYLLKDMAGLLAPDDAYDVIFSLKQELDVPWRSTAIRRAAWLRCLSSRPSRQAWISSTRVLRRSLCVRRTLPSRP
jgi:pyruvate carboxylase subunit B